MEYKESNSDVGSSAFFSYSNPQSSGNQFPNEIAYHNEGWRVVYPNTINEDAWNFAPVKRLVDFVSDASDDDFKDSFEQYFNKDSILRYYLFDMFIGENVSPFKWRHLSKTFLIAGNSLEPLVPECKNLKDWTISREV